MYICIDGGTTNTRVALSDGFRVVETIRLSVGAGASMENKQQLYDGVRSAVNTFKQKYNEGALEAVLASGMITSEGGLAEIKHICAPAGLNELHHAVAKKVIPQLFDEPIYFIPGVKIVHDGVTTDVMRGEETETVGLMHLLAMQGKQGFILPGSHSKLICTDDTGRIASFSTMLTGEMIASLSQNTILKQSVDLSAGLTEASLYAGYECARDRGINDALFQVRVLSRFAGASADEAYSFFIGAVLQGEVDAVARWDVSLVTLAGKKQIKDAEALLLNRYTDKMVRTVSEEAAQNAPACGMVRIFQG